MFDKKVTSTSRSLVLWKKKNVSCNNMIQKTQDRFNIHSKNRTHLGYDPFLLVMQEHTNKSQFVIAKAHSVPGNVIIS